MQRFNINWTAKTLVNQMSKGFVNFDNAIQRGLVWDNDKKSLLIHSMLYNYAIPAMYFTREDKLYNSLDGKQRSNAIYQYMNDAFSLTANTPPIFDEDGAEISIAGMTFSQLPEWAQDRIKDYNLTIYYYEDMTQDEVREFFRRLNNGKPLSSIEITRVQTPCLTEFQDLAKHDAIQSIVSAAGKNHFTDEVIAMQLYHITTEEHPNLTTKLFREWARSVTVSHEHMERIRNGLDACNTFVEYAHATDIKIYRTVKMRTHFISCAYYCTLAVECNISQDDINSTLISFFNGNPSTSEEYNNSVTAGSAKSAAVLSRKNVMKSLISIEK